jgi:murein DD-endopeptidase MepM/ murein hydrolase activator NlpD
MPTKLNVTTKVMNTSETKMTRGFYPSADDKHKGVDLIPRSTAETPEILAYADGVVTYAANITGTTGPKGNAAMGTTVAIKHRDGTLTRYQHLKAGSLRVKKGDNVKKGQPIALYGRPTTGNSTGCHLHFDISLPTKPSCKCIKSTFNSETRYYVDPVPYLTKKAATSPSVPSPATSDSQSGTAYKVTAKSLRVRSGPGTQYGTIGYLSSGAKVTVYSVKDGFGHITPGNAEWVSMEYLKKI